MKKINLIKQENKNLKEELNHITIKYKKLKKFLTSNNFKKLFDSLISKNDCLINEILSKVSYLFVKQEKIKLINNLKNIQWSVLSTINNSNSKCNSNRSKLTIKHFTNTKSLDNNKYQNNQKFSFKKLNKVNIIPIKKINLNLNTKEYLNNNNDKSSFIESIVYKKKNFTNPELEHNKEDLEIYINDLKIS